MTDMQVIDAITEAFEDSTHDDNAFARAIDGIDWAETFEADGERYHITHGGMTFTTPSTDPFQVTRDWPATFAFADGSGTIDVFGRTTAYR